MSAAAMAVLAGDTLAGRRRRRLALVYGVSLAGCAFVLLPVLWMLSTALKDDNAVFSVPPRVLPDHLRWSNFTTATRLIPFWRYLANSVLVAGVGALGTVASSALAAYALARLRARGLNLAFG
ncbi:MAG: hypothetical protein ACRDZW_03455, partial [Acidimicrobiales bacterium]